MKRLVDRFERRLFFVVPLSVLILLAVGTGPTTAAIYTSSASFFSDLGALGTPSQTLDFEGVSASPTPYTIAEGDPLGGITFDDIITFRALSNLEQLAVDDEYTTTSGTNYLGGGGGPGEVLFYGGDSFEMSFATANAIGLFVITAENPTAPNQTIFDDDVRLSNGVVTAGIDVSESEQTLSDGSLVYFIGLIDDQAPFTTATIDTENDFFIFNIDDITVDQANVVPEPASCVVWFMLLIGCTIARFAWTRR